MKRQMGRLAMRVEGDWWVAYYAAPDTMEDALDLGRIRMAAVQDQTHKQAFMAADDSGHTRRGAVAAFQDWLSGNFWACGADQYEARRQAILARLPELRGKNLACFCPLDQPCHADVLLEIANG